jgi:hypothetical protein
MAQVQYSHYCEVCDKQTLHTKDRVNHVLHLILSICTLGLWLIVWLVLGISNSTAKPRCAVCGTRRGETNDPELRYREHMDAITRANEQHAKAIKP